MKVDEDVQAFAIAPDNRIVMKNITIATDLGTRVTIASGLRASDRVVNNPPDSLTTGDKVRIGTGSDGV